MTKKKSFETMTIPELEAAIEDNMTQRAELSAHAKLYQARINELRGMEQLESMSSEERRALAQAITNAGGIESLEKMGELGG